MQNSNEKFKIELKHRIYNWVLRLIKFIDVLPKTSVCQVMGKQLLRSGTSIIANFVEAQAASSRKDFANFITYALKSANESKVWLALLRDTGNGSKIEGEWLLKELLEIANILAKIILSTKGKK
ncbi:MAG: four helix bundle protein [Candidatus Taylorbacteria bacterium CG11_big_fil_rev_8_21_14_0_20_46_11]|uniref:Four helix bundle protein n=1 Tax=Candidatus Taylorbacteria bacterium CG11_big_fil_rev_8_21_14_0_20_46_11 TaxID=1975025 RepID=A0A2H0KE14_9BACT|nr:MAG: four helix bundle protein [Candidatus Taylorbacteria bacterium CG11_big_fil_rev_8_21_14_0_20_46_11]